MSRKYEKRSPEFREFTAVVQSPVAPYLQRMPGAHSPQSIGTHPLHQLLLEGYSWESGSKKLALGETGTAYDGRYPNGHAGTHGSDCLVAMMQTSKIHGVPVHIGTLAYLHDTAHEIKAYGHFLRFGHENFLSLEHQFPDQPVTKFSLVDMLYLSTSTTTPKEFVENVNAYRGRIPVRDSIKYASTALRTKGRKVR